VYIFFFEKMQQNDVSNRHMYREVEIMQTGKSESPDYLQAQTPLDVEQLLTLYADDVLRVCNVYLGKRSLAEDAFQDVFVKVCLKADSYRGETPVRYWLLTIARNVCRDYLRSTWLSRVVSYEDWKEKKPSDGSLHGRRKGIQANKQEDAILTRMQDDSPLLVAVNALPARYKDVILLRYYYDLSNEEIAQQLKITESTVRSRIFRARKKLFPFMKGEEMHHV
jgi:RNA polymerase sigma-70 factor (ECF subfamily)